MDQLTGSVSVRRCAEVLGLSRSSYYRRKQGHRPEDLDAQIAKLLHETVEKYLFWGFWMIFHYLRKQGHGWNHKRVYRIWKAEGLNLRRPPARKKLKRKFQDLIAPAKVNQGWAMDFLSDWVIGQNQTAVRIINIIDECSRKALWTEAHTSIKAQTLTEILGKMIEWRGKPQYIRCDNGPEFISEHLRDWAQKQGIEIRFTQPGKPTQNGLIERLNGTLRTECLNLEWFENIETLNQQIQKWWMTYNTIRPHSSLRYLTPDEFEASNEKFYSNLVAV